MLFSSFVIGKLAVAFIKVFDSMTIWTKKFDIIMVVIFAISIFMMKFQNANYLTISTMLAFFYFSKEKVFYSFRCGAFMGLFAFHSSPIRIGRNNGFAWICFPSTRNRAILLRNMPSMALKFFATVSTFYKHFWISNWSFIEASNRTPLSFRGWFNTKFMAAANTYSIIKRFGAIFDGSALMRTSSTPNWSASSKYNSTLSTYC